MIPDFNVGVPLLSYTAAFPESPDTLTCAPAAIPSSLVLSPSAKAPSEGFTCSVEIVTALTPARSVTSESINAPAANTLIASVTSALVSILVSLVLSAAEIILPEPASVTSLRSAAAIVIFPEPSKAFPAIFLAVSSVVAVAAFPLISPTIVELKVLESAIV